MADNTKNENANKVRIKPVDGKDQDAIWVFPVDAKEAIKSGRYEAVGEAPAGKADWIPDSEPEEVTEPDEGTEGDEGTEDDDTDESLDETVKQVKSMNTDELIAFVTENELVIEGFEGMNLRTKRAAVIEALEGPEGE